MWVVCVVLIESCVRFEHIVLRRLWLSWRQMTTASSWLEWQSTLYVLDFWHSTSTAVLWLVTLACDSDRIECRSQCQLTSIFHTQTDNVQHSDWWSAVEFLGINIDMLPCWYLLRKLLLYMYLKLSFVGVTYRWVLIHPSLLGRFWRNFTSTTTLKNSVQRFCSVAIEWIGKWRSRKERRLLERKTWGHYSRARTERLSSAPKTAAT